MEMQVAGLKRATKSKILTQQVLFVSGTKKG